MSESGRHQDGDSVKDVQPNPDTAPHAHAFTVQHLSPQNDVGCQQEVVALAGVSDQALLQQHQQQQEGESMADAWWPAYLASTLTGWSLNAVNSCFCDKCKRSFSSSLSVLQHFRGSYCHMATVEALEAVQALYMYDYCQYSCNAPTYDNYGYSYSMPMGYYNDGTQQYGWDHLQLSTGGSVSPQHLNELPSSIFTASSDVSEEQLQEEEQQGHLRRQPPPPPPPPQQRAQQQKKPVAGAGGRRGQGRPGGQQGSAGFKSSKQAPASPVSGPAYDAAFPSLGGAASPPPARKWTPAAATRKLRVEAAEWAPGCSGACFSSLSLKAEAAARAAAAKAAEAAAQAEAEAPVEEAAAEVPAAAAAAKEEQAAAPAASKAPQAAGMSWCKVVSRSKPGAATPVQA